jgi:hypothetical protein
MPAAWIVTGRRRLNLVVARRSSAILPSLAILEAAFDEAWLTLKCNGIASADGTDRFGILIYTATAGAQGTLDQESNRLRRKS